MRSTLLTIRFLLLLLLLVADDDTVYQGLITARLVSRSCSLCAVHVHSGDLFVIESTKCEKCTNILHFDCFNRQETGIKQKRWMYYIFIYIWSCKMLNCIDGGREIPCEIYCLRCMLRSNCTHWHTYLSSMDLASRNSFNMPSRPMSRFSTHTDTHTHSLLFDRRHNHHRKWIFHKMWNINRTIAHIFYQ